MRSTFMNLKISPPFTVNGMPQLCGFISWLFKINYFNNMSPHYKHIYLCHPPFKRLSPVSDVYEAELEASRSHFPLPPPSAPLRVHQWRSDHSPFSPSPYLLMMLSLITYSPSSSLFSYTTSLLSVPLFAGNNYLKQEISKFLIWNLIRSSKSCSSINSPMICYEEFWCLVWARPATPPRPTL